MVTAAAQALSNPGMRPRHWEQLSKDLGQTLQPDANFTLAVALQKGLQQDLDTIVRVADNASKEYSIEQVGRRGGAAWYLWGLGMMSQHVLPSTPWSHKLDWHACSKARTGERRPCVLFAKSLPCSCDSQALEKLVNEWEGAELMVIPYRETGTFVVKVEEALSQGLDDAIVMLQSMQFSPYKKPFEDKLAKWDTQLNLVSFCGRQHQLNTGLVTASAAVRQANMTIEHANAYLKGPVYNLCPATPCHTQGGTLASCVVRNPIGDKAPTHGGALQVSEVIEQWLTLQRGWMYLEPIFSSPDIMQQLPMEGKRFAAVDRSWRKTLDGAKKNPNLLKVGWLLHPNSIPSAPHWHVATIVWTNLFDTYRVSASLAVTRSLLRHPLPGLGGAATCFGCVFDA
jgi:hypothetical protein